MIRWLIAVLLLLAQPLGAAEAPDVMVTGDAIPAPLAGLTGSPGQGREVFVDRQGGHCVLCHQVATLDAPFQGDIGPALDDIGADDDLPDELLSLTL